MKILKVIELGKCEFCSKEVEVCEIQTDTNRTATLCFKDLQKLARLNLKEKAKV
jgi:predicted transglutaminase-like cysteine proteinase